MRADVAVLEKGGDSARGSYHSRDGGLAAVICGQTGGTSCARTSSSAVVRLVRPISAQIVSTMTGIARDRCSHRPAECVGGGG